MQSFAQRFRFSQRIFVRTCLAAVLIALTACGANQPTRGTADTGAASGYAIEQVPLLLEQAAAATPAERPAMLLDAVEILLAHGETDWARNIITGITAAALTDHDYARHQLLSSQLAVASGSHFSAQAQLNEPRLLDVLERLPAGLAAALREQRAQVLASVGEYQLSIEERAKLDELLASSREFDEQRRAENHDQLWQTLMKLSQSDLSNLKEQASDSTLRGWYTLAEVSKSHQSNLNRQLTAVDEWARHWPEHPASLRLPADLQLLRDLVENQPRQVALLLPLTGNLEQAAVAIRDGFMAAYYDSIANGELVPDVRIYDTAVLEVQAAYDRAIEEGAQVVVGPLQKDAIAELALRPDLAVPTLALNYAEVPYADFQQLYQFGLAVEDEAQQVARQAWQDGHRRALIFAPVSSWGDRSVDTFWQEWQALGGEITRDYRFTGNDDYLRVIASAMHITDSKERAQQLRRMLGRSIEFEPRRRQDVDMVYLVANAQQARQIKPTLAFHYAGDLPVYSTSQVYSGEDPKANQDMNGIRFTSLPWFFNEKAPEREALYRYTDTAASYQRLYAFGADAYHLFPRLRQLREVEGARYYGYTGALSLNSAGKIERQQTWAQFVRGRAQAMPTISEDDG